MIILQRMSKCMRLLSSSLKIKLKTNIILEDMFHRPNKYIHYCDLSKLNTPSAMIQSDHKNTFSRSKSRTLRSTVSKYGHFFVSLSSATLKGFCIPELFLLVIPMTNQNVIQKNRLFENPFCLIVQKARLWEQTMHFTIPRSLTVT